MRQPVGPSSARALPLCLLAWLLLVPVSGHTQMITTVFSTDFESGIPAEMSAPGCVITGVQGYAGLGHPGNQFSGSFLRYSSQPLHDTALTITGLPPHDHLDLRFLLAVVDSWDGTELLEVFVDNELRFSNWFQLALGDTSSYAAPPGGLLSSGVNLGFSNGVYYFRDRAYDMSLEPAFQEIPHTASSVTIVWRLGATSGSAAENWQGSDDESWAIDRLAVDVRSPASGVPGGDAAGGFSLGAPWPNPSRGGSLNIGFSLASGSSATLNLFDVTGRRVWSREVGSLGAGPHALQFATSELARGAYFLQLAQGPDLARRRIILGP